MTRFPQSPPPLLTSLSILYLTSKYSLYSPGPSVSTARHWTRHCGCHTAGNEGLQAQTGQFHGFPLLCSMSNILHPSTEMLNALQSLLPTHEPFSHAAPDSSVYLLASDCWLTLSQPLWGCDSGLLLVATTHSHCDEHLEGILWTVILTKAARGWLQYQLRADCSLCVCSTDL